MPALTCRHYPERQDYWHVYYGDVHVGAIARRTGFPVDVDQWDWSCGFYPGMEPAQDRSGCCDRFQSCACGFQGRMAPDPAEGDRGQFQEWRDQRD